MAFLIWLGLTILLFNIHPVLGALMFLVAFLK